MPAYWLARAKVIDPVQYKRCTDRIPAIMDKYGGRALWRGAPYQTREYDHFDRLALIEFDSMEDVEECFVAPEHKDAAEFRRRGAGDNEFTIVGGGEHTRGNT